MPSFTRRQLIQGFAGLGSTALASLARAAQTPATNAAAQPLSADVLPRGVRARFVNDVNGIRIHMLEAGFDGPRRPLLVLLHGFPELAYSWRKVMPPLAAAGITSSRPRSAGAADEHGRCAAGREARGCRIARSDLRRTGEA